MKPESRTRFAVRLAAVLAACAGGATSVNAQVFESPQTTALKWSTGETQAVNLMTPSQVQSAITQLAARPDQSRVLVHLAYPLNQTQRNELANAGLRLTTALGGTSFFATLDSSADAGVLARSAIASIGQIEQSQKLHLDFQNDIIRPWMLSSFDVAKSPELRELKEGGFVTINELDSIGINPSVAIVVMLHKDADRFATSKRIAKAYGAQILSHTDAINTVVLSVKPNQIKQISNDDSVMWIEPPLPKLSTLNAENRALVGVNAVNDPPYGLDGSGVDVLVYDGGKVASHPDFESRLTIGPSDTSGVITHATHVAGTIGGAGVVNFNNRGMAPGVNIISYGFEQKGGLSEGFLYTDPGDLEADYTEAIQLFGAEIANNSIGTNTAPNGFDCLTTGNYGVTSALIDSIARGSTGSPFRIVWANGNERQSSRCQGDDNGNFGEFYSTAPPACAKNHITVGSVDSNSDLTSSFSSWGPTDDGRIKPDISAPGCQLGGDGGVTSTNSSGGYVSFCGTSMASPTTAGVSSLILEQYRMTFPDRPDPMNATLKTLLANTAVDRGNPGPDYKYGYGSIRAVPAVDTVIAENVIESEVAQGGVYRGIIIVGAGETELRATIAWDDVPAAPNVNNALVNDLDLRIIDSGGNVFLPWTLDPQNPNGNAGQNVADHLNNIEQVSIMNPAPGAYTVEVTGFNIADGPTQTFGLSTSTTLINCSSAGIASIGGNLFSCSGTANVQVVDCDLNSSDAIIDTVDVMVTSDSQVGGALILTLTETAAESATFTGSFSFADTNGADVLVSEGDTMSLTYIDADDGNGNTNVPVVSSATIDCTAPAIISTSASLVSSNFADVDVQTDEGSDIVVNFGTSMGSLDQSVESNGLVTNHTVTLEGLTILTDYFYTVETTDTAGNTTLHDNNGNGYTFTTLNGPTPVYEFLVDDTNPGWATTGDWAFGNPAGFGGDPSSGNTGNNVYGYNLNGAYPDNLPERYLTTDPMDFTGITGVGLEFQRWLGIESSIWDQAAIEIRLGNGVWQNVWSHTGGTVTPSSWTFVSYDISSVADNQPNVQIRWVMGTTDSSVTYAGWNIDDIVFTGVQPVEDCAADLTGDGELNFFDVSAFLSAFSAMDPAADFTGDGEFNFFDVSAFLAAFGAGCP